MRYVVCFLMASVVASQTSFDSAKLEAVRANLAAKNTHALYIVKDGKVAP